MSLRIATVAWVSTCIGLLAVHSLGNGPGHALQDALLAAPARQDVDDQKPRDMLITADGLQSRLDERDLRILDTRSRDAYRRGHVPGAVHVDVADWKALSLSEGGLQDELAWARKVGETGIRRSSTVVVYGDRVPDTARIWWLVKYVGVEDVRILDGGWDAWTAGEGPVSESAPNVQPAEFRPEFQSDRVVGMETVEKSLADQGLHVVDARSSGEYIGEEVRGERGGHIPGATHLEWKHLLRKDGRFKSPEELRRLFRKRGIRPGESTACY